MTTYRYPEDSPASEYDSFRDWVEDRLQDAEEIYRQWIAGDRRINWLPLYEGPQPPPDELHEGFLLGFPACRS